MTVRELIDRLSAEDPDRLVVMASDAEGNSYSPLAGYWVGAYAAETTWRGEAGLETLTEEDERNGYGKGDVVDGVPAVILKPTN